MLLLAPFLILGLAAFSHDAPARGIDFNINDDAAQFRYIAYDGRAGGFGQREIDIGLLYTSDDDYLGLFGAQVIAEAGAASPGLDAGIGLKVFGARSGRADIFSVSIGGQLRYALPPHQRILFRAEGFFSPQIVTFGDADRFSYFTASVGYEVVPQASVYLGYRDIRARLEDGGGTRKVEDGAHIGMRFEF